MLRLDNATARRLLLDRYALMKNPRRALPRTGLLSLIETLGFVQLDSISTIERAHHMILRARADGYRQEELWRLAERERQLFEHWTHDAALLPITFYRYWRPRFILERESLLPRWIKWHGEGFAERLAIVLDHVRQGGPVRARDLAPDKPKGGSSSEPGWWNWHHDKVALEFLWRTGELSVTRREGFQKVYDLTERVVPEQRRCADCSHNELVDWACTEALTRLGWGIAGDIAGFWASVSHAEVSGWVERQPEGRLIEVEVEAAVEGRPRRALALAEIIDPILARIDSMEPPSRLRVLSPFDPLIRDRNRLARFFGFDYRIEVFVPEAKRQYGYYVCPLLEGNRLVGRIDMRHKRDAGGLVVRRVWWELNVRATKGRLARLEAELERCRRFIGADTVRYEAGWLGS